MTPLFFVKYTKTTLTTWKCVKRYLNNNNVMEVRWFHSVMSSVAPGIIRISWNYQLPRGSCIVCKVLQLCMCSAGSVPLPFSAGYSMTVDWRGKKKQCLSRWMSLRAPPCSSAVCSWQRLVGRSSHNRQRLLPLKSLCVWQRCFRSFSNTYTSLPCIKRNFTLNEWAVLAWDAHGCVRSNYCSTSEHRCLTLNHT